MAAWKCPAITIGSVPITQQTFSWQLPAGVTPYTTSVSVPNSVSDALAALENPTKIFIEVTGGVYGRPDRLLKEFGPVYLLEPRKTDPYHTTWSLADARWAWRGKKLYCSYNKTRAKNQKGLGSTAAPAAPRSISKGVGVSGNTPPADPAVLRQQFDTFSVGRYLPWSVRGDGRPYNMKEIIEIELEKFSIPFNPSVVDDKGVYTIENVELNGVDIYAGLADLLARSRLSLGILPTGEVYVYSLDFLEEAGSNAQLVAALQNNNKTRPGIVYKSDKSRIRPRSVEVRFERRQETRLVASSSRTIRQTGGVVARSTVGVGGAPIPVGTNPPVWDLEDVRERRVIACENVMPCPYPVTSVYTGREFNIGEFLPVYEYLESLTPPLSESDLRQLWFSSVLERKYAKAVATETGTAESTANEQFVAGLISAVRAHYRQTYQIDPYWMDRMRDWSPRRVAVLDNYSRYAPPAPLWSDYCVIPKARHPAVAKRTALWSQHAYNWLVDTEDPLRQRPTAGTVGVVSMPLGIFRVSYPPLIDQVVAEIIPSAITPLPGVSVAGANSLLRESSLTEDFTLETLVSVVWDVDRDDDFDSRKKYHVVYSSYPDQARGPAIDYLSREEYARYAVREPESTAVGAGAGAVLDPSVPVNAGLLDAIAQSESARIINQFKDRWVGFVTLAGHHDFYCTGNIKNIIFSFSPGAGYETSVDMRDIPPNPTLEQTLPQKHLDYLYRHVSRADTTNEVAQ